MRWGTPHAAGHSSCGGALLMRRGTPHAAKRSSCPPYHTTLDIIMSKYYTQYKFVLRTRSMYVSNMPNSKGHTPVSKGNFFMNNQPDHTSAEAFASRFFSGEFSANPFPLFAQMRSMGS